MAPTPLPEVAEIIQPPADALFEEPLTGDEVVITGLSGKYPNSPDTQKFMENLFGQVDMISGDSRRWKLDHPEIPQRSGKIDTLKKFDAQFFGVHYKQAWTMDPMCRLLLESAYSAVIDAGMNPKSLRNSKTGVFVGSTTSESEKTWFYEKAQVNGFGIVGCSRAMFANRLSYWLGTTGPSYTVDTACNSSLSALEHAYKAIRSGYCDAAIVGGTQLCMHPYVSLLTNRLGFLSKDGVTKSFDVNGDGYARSETVAVIVLQKAKDAKRIYSQVVHAASNCEGYIEGKLLYRTPECQRGFLEKFYREINVNPSVVEYVEAFGCGLYNQDRAELEAIDAVFCKDRKTPIYVGSVKSNAGHAEAAAGISALTKVALMYHRATIPANLNCNSPIPTDGIQAGRIKIVTENTPFNEGYVALCGYSYSGNNCHVLLKGVKRKAPKEENACSLPRLVVASGRTQSAIDKILDYIGKAPLNSEFLGLLHSIHEFEVPGLIYRGYNILTTEDGKTKSLAKSSEYFSGGKRPIWFVYSGMGSQWSGMAIQLMRYPTFAAAIERCHKALEPKGINLTHIVTEQDPKMFDNVLHSFVGIAAVQIGLTDLLTQMGIKPDFVIGHSVGELGCAYADGCFTAEQMVLAAYSRGMASLETPFIRGSMAAVGVGYSEIKSMCPPEIEVACHNGPESSTISGPADIMKQFVEELTSKGIFAKEVPCSNIAYHSRYISEAGPKLLAYLREVIPEPSTRSERWLSTSVPQQQWTDPEAQLCSAEYHTKNLLSPVLFEETCRNIPSNAITIEIAPHGLLQAILRRSLKSDCINVALTKRGHRDNVEFFLNAIGKLYEVGVNPKVANLYPKVEFPVPGSTPQLSHLVEWEHSDDWHEASYEPMTMVKSGERSFVMSLHDDEYRFLSGYHINGINMLPPMACLVMAWDTVARMVGVPYQKLSVIFEDVHFHSLVTIPEDKPLELVICIQKATGNFELIHNGANMVNGRLRREKSKNIVLRDAIEGENDTTHTVTLSSKDIYKLFTLKGLNYSGSFRPVESYNTITQKADVSWDNNWVTFLESFLQVLDLSSENDNLLRPKLIRRLAINVKAHKRHIDSFDDDSKPIFPVSCLSHCDTTSTVGVELEGLRTVEIPTRSDKTQAVLERFQFVPHIANDINTLEDAMSYAVQLALQNYAGGNRKFQVVELLNKTFKGQQPSLASLIRRVLRRNPGVEYDVTIATENTSNIDKLLPCLESVGRVDFFVGDDLVNRKMLLDQIDAVLSNGGFVVSREKLPPTVSNLRLKQLNFVSSINAGGTNFVVFNKRMDVDDVRYLRVKADETSSWIEKVQEELPKCKRVVLISEQDPMSGIIGFVNCVRKERFGDRVQAIVVADYSAPAFDPDLPLYKLQLAKNLAINVYMQGKWGTYNHLPAPEPSVLVPYASLVIGQVGELQSLKWVEQSLASLGPNPVHVYYSALNYMDVQKATNRLHFTSIDDVNRTNAFGMEYCGRTSSGDRVMGLVPNGALSTIVTPVPDLTWEIPANWTMEEAITVPQAYANAFYCLNIRLPEHTRPNPRILIHCGTGALGLAAIHIALSRKWEVFTTVSSNEKKDFLLKMFPQLKEKNIGSSRDASFEEMVACNTEGKLVNIIINTLGGKLREASIRCLTSFSCMIDLSRGEVFENSPFGMYSLSNHRDYLFASVSNIFKEDGHETRKKIHDLISEGIKEGYVCPLPRTSFAHDDVKEAFTYMASARHLGKVVVKFRHEEKMAKVEPKPRSVRAVPNLFYPEDKSFIILSGDSGLGTELAGWLVEHGAKNIVLHSRRKCEDNYLEYRVATWKSRGVQVLLSSLDTQKDQGCKQLLADAMKLAPVHGVYFLPNSVKVEKFENSLPEYYTEEFRRSVVPVARIDGLTKILCPQLREFVVITSQAWSRGMAGRSHSACANDVIHAITQARQTLSLPSATLMLGSYGEQDIAINEEWWDTQMLDTKAQSVSSILSALGRLLRSEEPVIACHIPGTDEMRNVDLIGVFESVLGKALIQEASDDQRFEDMGVDLFTAKQIASILAREYHLFYTADFLRRLNVSGMRKLQYEVENEMKVAHRSGLSALYPELEAEEYTATEPIMKMATRITDGCEAEDQFSFEDSYIWLVPGVDGHRSIFSSICQRLKSKVFAFQYGLDHPNETVGDIAQRLFKLMKSRQRDQNFKLFAYSFGVSVALELAALLEKEGYSGKIFCLEGGGPEYFKEILEQYFGDWSEAQLQNETIKHVWKLLDGKFDESMTEIFNESTDWDSKVEKCMHIMNTTMKYSKENQRLFLQAAYKRILTARNYTANDLKPLKSEIILIKGKNGFDSKDCGLSRFAQKPLKIFEIESDHGMAPFDLQCSAIVNREFGLDEAFKTINNCKMYTLYSNTFS